MANRLVKCICKTEKIKNPPGAQAFFELFFVFFRFFLWIERFFFVFRWLKEFVFLVFKRFRNDLGIGSGTVGLVGGEAAANGFLFFGDFPWLVIGWIAGCF